MKPLSQGFAISIKRLCLCLVNKTALRLSTHKKTRNVDDCRHHGSRSVVVSSCVSARADGHTGVISIDSTRANCAINFVGKVIASIPHPAQRMQRAGSRDIYICVVREILVELSVRRKVTGPAAARFNKEAGRTRKTGFEMLRATLNLARGNIEDRAYALLRQAVLPTRRELMS